MKNFFPSRRVADHPRISLKRSWLLGLLLLAAPGRLLAQTTLGGTVFEDVNYGGGAGRTYVAANNSATTSGFVSGSIRCAGATVELYNAFTNSYLNTTTTDASGGYSFAGLAAGNYVVRVVNRTVASPRVGSVAGLLPVQTFRTNAGAADVNRVGGENPTVTDSGPNLIGAGSVTLAFAGQTSTGDNTLFLDDVEILSGGLPLATNPIANPGFEAGTLAGATAPGYEYTPTGTGVAWTFNPGAGIQANNSAFTPPNTSFGSRAAFLQLSGSLNQTFTLPAGTYTVRFQAANRSSGGQQSVNVIVNGTTVLANVQAPLGSYATTPYVTAAFTVTAGSTAAPLNSIVAQSLAPVTVGSAPVTGVDFGYSFDVVSNTNDAGQGSVRQFLLNANALANTSLAQAGQVLGRETSIFMIPNGAAGAAAPAGLQRTPALTSGLNASNGTNRWALINVISTLPTFSAAGTTLDGGTQTLNVQDSNPGRVGLGGTGGQFATVGTSAIAFAQFERPEVEIYAGNGFANILVLNASTTTVRGLALHGSGGGTVQVSGGTGVVIENNLIGINAFEIEDPNLVLAGTTSTLGINLNATTMDVAVQRNVVAFCSNSGINFPTGGTGAGSNVLVLRNELAQNGYRQAGGDNISVGDGGGSGPVRILYNLIRTSNSDGVQFDIGRVALGGTGYNVVRNNTFFDSGNGGESIAQSQLEGAALLYLQRTAGAGGTTGTNADSVAFNVFNQTQASAIVVGYGQRGVIISRNSTYFNGTPFNKPTGGNLGIDLITDPSYAVNSNQDYGNGDGVTRNTGTLTNALGNAGMNYPVLTLASATGNTSATVNVAGFVGSAAGQTTFAGAIVELYTADNVQANNNGPVSVLNPTILPHGEGRTYLGTLVADGNGNFSGTLNVPANTPPLSGAAISGALTATAYLPGRGTSEFGPNRPIIVSADVEAVFTASSGATTAGGTGSFTVRFANQALFGPVTAAGVVATVQLPPNLTGVTATGGSYNATTGLVTFTGYTTGAGGSLTTGATFSSTITYTQPTLAPVTATASISTITNEAGQTANNTAVATNNTTLLYDVTTTVSGPATVTAGNQVAYNVTTISVGGAAFPSPAPQVVQTVSVPAGATNVFVTGGGVITGSTGAGFTVTFPTIAALAGGQRLTNTVSFTAPATGYSVGAAVSTSPADAVAGNNTASAATTVGAATTGQANAFVLVSASSLSAAPGTPVSFAVTQGNRGPNPATGVSTTVVIPPGLPTSGAGVVTINGAGPTGTSGTVATYAGGTTYNSATGLVVFPTIASQSAGAGSNAAYTIGFNAPASGVATATAAVLTASPDNIPADNQATAQVSVSPTAPADLAVTLSGPSGAIVGQLLSYTYTTTNNGPALATDVAQVINIPVGLDLTGFEALTVNGAGPTSVVGTVATYAGGITYNAASGRLLVPPLAALGPNGVSTTTFAYVAPLNGGLNITASGGSSSTSFETSLANNLASISTNLLVVTDVQVSLTGVGQISPGNRITYGVSAYNDGPGAAPGVATSVSLPTGLPLSGPNAVQLNGAGPAGVSGTTATYSDGATYNSSTGLVTLLAISNLQPGVTALNTVSFVLPTGFIGTLVSTATAVVTGIIDFVPSNNTAVVQPLVVPASGTSNIGTVITGPASVAAGQPVVYTMTTSSPGAASNGVLQFVQLPPGLNANGGTVTVTLGGSPVTAVYDAVSGLLTLPPVISLGAGSSLVYTINISKATGSGPLLLTATVSSNELDSDPSNNISVASVAVNTVTGLSTTINGPATTTPGTNVSYLIASINNGPSITFFTAQTVTVPAGATNVTLNGQPVTPGAGGVVTLSVGPAPSLLLVGLANAVTNILSFTAPGAAGSSFTVPTTLTAGGPGSPTPASASQTTAVSSPVPLARNVVNVLQAPQANTAAVPLPISPLSGLAQGVASLASYTLQTLPLASQGLLFVSNGSTNTVLNATNFPGLVLTTAQAASLRFLPAAGFSGNATFTYLTTDNAGSISNVARYLVPVGPDVASLYATTPVRGGTTSYANGYVLAFVTDPNGAVYTAAGQLYQTTGATPGELVAGTVSNGLPATGTNALLTPTTGPGSVAGPAGNASNVLPAGTALDAATGQIKVINRTLLVAGTYTVNITTTDVFGGVTTQPVTFVIGTSPLPVELTAFVATAVNNQDTKLTWRTAAELNNDHWNIERSLDGRDFAKFAEVAGQGSKNAPTDYTLVDANAVRRATTLYYRLTQVDADGRSTTSTVQTVRFGKALAGFGVYPNPAGTFANFDLTALPTGSYTVTLTDLAGRLVRTLTLEAGQRHPVTLPELASGTYLVTVQGTADNAALHLVQRLTKE